MLACLRGGLYRGQARGTGTCWECRQAGSSCSLMPYAGWEWNTSRLLAPHLVPQQAGYCWGRINTHLGWAWPPCECCIPFLDRRKPTSHQGIWQGKEIPFYLQKTSHCCFLYQPWKPPCSSSHWPVFPVLDKQHLRVLKYEHVFLLSSWKDLDFPLGTNLSSTTATLLSRLSHVAILFYMSWVRGTK